MRYLSDNPNVLQASAHQLGDVIGEKLHTEQSQHGSRASEWRNRSSFARRNLAEETRLSSPSVLTSAK